jgi:hypothetical protein
MKVTRFPLFIFSIVSSLALLTATSCKKSNSSSSSGNSISATIAGSAFSPSTTEATYSESGGYWDIAGLTVKSGDTVAIEAMIFSPFTLNQPFNTDTTDMTLFYYTNGASGKEYGVGSYWFGGGNGLATMTVTSLDTTAHKISGTFSGSLYATLSDSVVFTNGKFSTTYTVGP